MSDSGSKNTRPLRNALGVLGSALVVIGSKLVLIVIGGVITIVLSCLVLFVALSPQDPSDKEMLRHYAEHKTEFARLAEMFATEEELSLVNPDTGACLTTERQHVEPGESGKCDEYIQLFRSLEFGWAYVDGAQVYLSVYTWGWTPGGLTKGFLYTTDSSDLHGVMVEDTGTRGNPMPRYRKIDENWYIFFR